MPTPFPSQLTGAMFLANRQAALLADEPRVGKTGAAIIASDYVFARKIIVVTKSSARAQWGRDYADWQAFPRSVQVIYSGNDKVDPDVGVVVVGWGMVFDKRLHAQLLERQSDLLILDESHEAKNPEAKRTIAVYGATDGTIWFARGALCNGTRHTWPLSGTPIPNAPNDLHPMLRALAPERLIANTEKGWPDVTSYNAFMHRYCVVKKKYVGGQWIEYALKGRNEEELRARLEGFWLRRTQKDVGIREPLYSYLMLHADKIPAELKALEKDPRTAAILAAAEAGERLTGEDSNSPRHSAPAHRPNHRTQRRRGGKRRAR